MKTINIGYIQKLFSSDVSRQGLTAAEKRGAIPAASRRQRGSIQARVWTPEDLPAIGAKYGFLKPLHRPLCVCVFTTKGGVLKTSLAFNIARMAALHNVRTCVVGLDLQCDITTALGLEQEEEEIESLTQILEEEPSYGLHDLFHGTKKLADIIQPTDLPSLFGIPETENLASLEANLAALTARERWLSRQVVEPLRDNFDLVVLDCSPNWNNLIGNALYACDILVSPIECRVHQFRNIEVFSRLLEQFREAIGVRHEHIFVPTRFSSSRRLSSEIRSWYLGNLPGTTMTAIREAVAGEEAMANHITVGEHAPGSVLATEMKELLVELWTRFERVAHEQVGAA